MLGALQVAGVVSIGVWVPAALALAVAALAPLLVHSDAMARSADVAIDLRHQLGAYLDMVTMLLAGNTGYEGALEQAARAGDGLLFRELRRRMREVATTGQSLVARTRTRRRRLRASSNSNRSPPRRRCRRTRARPWRAA